MMQIHSLTHEERGQQGHIRGKHQPPAKQSSIRSVQGFRVVWIAEGGVDKKACLPPMCSVLLLKVCGQDHDELMIIHDILEIVFLWCIAEVLKLIFYIILP